MSALQSPPPSGSAGDPHQKPGPGQSPGSDRHPRPSLQARLEGAQQESRAEDVGPVGAAGEPITLLRILEDGGRFQRDRSIGRIFHPGEVSFRESRSDNSLHISVEDDRIAAHVDRVSPLDLKAQRAPRYSLLRIAAHNASGMAGDLGRLLRGRQGDHRCELDCEWLWPDAKDGGTKRRGEPPGSPGPRPAKGKAGEVARSPLPAGNVQLEVGVAGRLDESRLSDAFACALGATPEDLSVVECPDDAALAATRADLQSQTVPSGSAPMRIRLARTPHGDVMMANVHHAVMDGFAALQVMSCVARSYAGDTPELAPLDLLALHDLPVRPATSGATRGVWLYRAAMEKVRNLLTPPALLVPDGARDEPGFGYHHVNLSEDDTRALVHFGHSGTSTDVLLAALHLAIGAWNAEHGRPGGRFSVLVSANLRSPRLRKEAVGNFSVTARVSTGRRHRSSTAKALEMVTAQTSRNRRSRTGTALLEALDRSGLLALWAKQSAIVLQPVTGNRDVDTAMLCNLGRLADPPAFGADAPTVEVWFSPPTRIPIGLSIGAATVSGRMHLVFRYPHRLFGGDAARRFAECYVHQLRVAGR